MRGGVAWANLTPCKGVIPLGGESAALRWVHTTNRCLEEGRLLTKARTGGPSPTLQFQENLEKEEDAVHEC